MDWDTYVSEFVVIQEPNAVVSLDKDFELTGTLEDIVNELMAVANLCSNQSVSWTLCSFDNKMVGFLDREWFFFSPNCDNYDSFFPILLKGRIHNSEKFLWEFRITRIHPGSYTGMSWLVKQINRFRRKSLRDM